jgi:hypothetical protein
MARATGLCVWARAAQLNQNGLPADAGAVLIEDRIQVKSAVIEDGQIRLEILTEGPGDAACCKSHKAQKSYALQNGSLPAGITRR